MSRPTATERMERILAVLPWVVQHQGASVSEICGRFGLERDELIADLEFVFYNVGLHPFTPDMLAEVTIDEDRVRVHIGEYFRRPLRLSHSEALALLTAGRALAARPGVDPDHTLERAVAKLAGVLGGGGADALDVELGRAAPDVLSAVQEALHEHRRLRIDYYSYARDAASTRQVDPIRLISREGNWYLHAHCHEAGGERLFRLDRISAAALGDPVSPPEEHGHTGDHTGDHTSDSWDLSLSPRTVRITAGEHARWVADTYPCDEVIELDDGRLSIVLPVTATAWLERLLLRLGPGVEVHDAATGEDLSAVATGAARRILERYRGPSAVSPR